MLFNRNIYNSIPPYPNRDSSAGSVIPFLQTISKGITMRTILFKCKKCGHLFSPYKRIRSDARKDSKGRIRYRHQCSRCGSRKLDPRSIQDYELLEKYFKREHYNIEILRIAEELYQARLRGEEVKVIMKNPFDFEFCMYANECKDPWKHLSIDDGELTRNCSNEDREKCYEKAKRKYQKRKKKVN